MRSEEIIVGRLRQTVLVYWSRALFYSGEHSLTRELVNNMEDAGSSRNVKYGENTKAIMTISENNEED